MRIYDRQGQPISAETWLKMRNSDRTLASDVLPNGYWVSTVYLGLDHRFGDGPPLIFETMVFRHDGTSVVDWGDLACDRYTTEAEAMAGHAAMVGAWRKFANRDADVEPENAVVITATPDTRPIRAIFLED